MRDMGNSLAGLNAKIAGTSYDSFQKMAGVVQVKTVTKGMKGIRDKALLPISLGLAYAGKEYGPVPRYGELMEQYIMSIIGYNQGYGYYQNWSGSN